MNKIVVYSLSAIAGVVAFGAAYIGFATMRGVAPETLPIVGALFASKVASTPPVVDVHAPVIPLASSEPVTPPDHAPTHAPGHAPTHAPAAHTEPAPAAVSAHLPIVPIARPEPTHAGIGPAYQTGSIFTKAELDGLAESLRAKLREADQRLAAIASQETLFADRGITLDERQKMLEDLRAELQVRERELRAREAELPVAVTGAAVVKVDPAAMGPFFADGDVSDLAKRLAGYEAPAAAKILAQLPVDRARELLDALPTAKWREYAEAYIATTTAK